MGHVGCQGVNPARLFCAQGGFPGVQVRPQGRIQRQFGQGTGLREQERALEVDISFLSVQLGDLAHDFPVSIDVGGVEAEAVVAFGPADVQVGRGTGSGQGGEGEVIRFQDRPPDAGRDDFPVVFHGNRPDRGNRGRKGFQEARRRVFPSALRQVIRMVDGEAHRSGGSPVVEAQDSGLSFRDADPGGQLQQAFGRRSSFLGQGSIPAPDDHIAGHPGPGGRVEHRHEAGTGQPGGTVLSGIDGRVSQDAVRAGGGRHRNPERAGAAALQQADFGGTGRSFLGNEFHIGNGAGVRI